MHSRHHVKEEERCQGQVQGHVQGLEVGPSHVPDRQAGLALYFIKGMQHALLLTLLIYLLLILYVLGIVNSHHH